MKRRDAVLTTRRLVIGSVVFGLFVLFDIFLFGWLILSSLSQRELEAALLETRQEAEPLAQALAAHASQHEGDMWVVVSVATETKTYIDDILNQRKLVRKLEIRDRDGTVAFGPYWSEEVKLPVDEVPRIELPDSETRELPIESRTALREIEVPIGEYGTLVIGVSDEELQKRISGLQLDLTRQASLIGVVTVLLLAAAFAAAWTLFHRARKSEEQAIESERLAYVGTLASGLAHEIRNPLNSLNLNMQMFEEEARGQQASGSQLRLLSLTRSELARLERLATNFLSYAKPRSLDLEEVPAVKLLEKVLGVLAGEIQAVGAEVAIEDESRGAKVRVDRHQIDQLLLNLVQNALAATEPSPVIRLRARRRDDLVALEVSDNGPGIPPEEQERVFDLFYSTKKGGTGLGLAIVQRIAEAHRAKLELESSPDRGTTVRLLLPAVTTSEAATKPSTSRALSRTSRRRSSPRSLPQS
ncbi:MAG: ATP-binding protein [Thermoanaerobaculia bacterium]